MQKVVLCLTLSLALVFGASLGAGAAGAQGGSAGDTRDRLSVKKKTVNKFFRRWVKMFAEAQPAVFPNAYISERWVSRIASNCERERYLPGSRRRPTWYCRFYFSLVETNRSNPNQWTLRSCLDAEILYVRRARSSRKLRFYYYVRRKLRRADALQLSCQLTEQSIRRWNESGPEYQPNVTEPTPYRPLEQPRIPPTVEDADELDILPPPSGEPGTPPLGPLKAPASGSATSSEHDMSCSGRWERYYLDPRYWIYICWWRDHSIFGAGFNTIQNFGLYYWAGDYNSDGYAIGRLFFTGVVPQINYTHS